MDSMLNRYQLSKCIRLLAKRAPRIRCSGFQKMTVTRSTGRFLVQHLLAFVFLGLVGSWISSPCFTVAQEPGFFGEYVAPILLQRCLGCHCAEKQEGGYRLDTWQWLNKPGDSKQGTVVPGVAADSELWKRITSQDEAVRMPPEGEPLAESEVKLIEQWLTAGAKVTQGNEETPLAALIPIVHYTPPPAVYSHALPITAIAWDPSDESLIANGYQELLQWNVADGKLIRRIPDFPPRIEEIQFSPRGDRLAVAGGVPGERGEIRWVAWPDGKVLLSIGQSRELPLAISFQGDDRILVAGGDYQVQQLQLMQGVTIRRWNVHSDWVVALGVGAREQEFLTIGRDRSVKLIDSVSGETLHSFAKHDSTPIAARALPGGDVLGSLDESGRRFRWKVGELQESGKDKWEGVRLARFSPSGEQIALVTSSGELKVRQWGDGKVMKRWELPKSMSTEAHPIYATSIGWSSHGDRLAVGSSDGDILIFKLDGDTLVLQFHASCDR